MNFDILDSLDDLGHSISSMDIIDCKQRRNLLSEENFACLRYCGVFKNDEEIEKALEAGTKSFEFTQLIEWLSKELQVLNKMESCINALTDAEDTSSFLVEVSSFLKELHCPYKSLLNGPISQRLLSVQSRRTLLDFLCTELLTARILHSKKEVKNALEIEMDDSSTAISLQNALKVLNIGPEEVESDSVTCITEMEKKVEPMLESKSVEPPILTETLSEELWESLGNLYESFVDEYTVRRKMLLTRLDVTIQSFNWGEGSKGKEARILNAYLSHRKKLKDKPVVKLSDVMAARESLLVVEKTSSANLVKNTKSSVNNILIGAVPDRGGRPKEQRPPVEMPNWMKRSQGGGRGDHRSGGRGGHWQGKNKKFRGHHNGGEGGGGGHRGGSFDSAGKY